MVVARNILRRRARASGGIAMPLLRRAVAWMAALSLSALAAAQPTAAQELSEYQVKAAFLYNFAKFVDWPEPKLDTADNRLHICVLGADPFGEELDATVDGKTIQGKWLTVLRLQSGDDLRHCHLLFIGDSGEFHLPFVLNEAREAHVLTVGDSPDFAFQGGMINFRMEENKVRFEINARAAEEAGLRISSQLLKLAVRLIGEPAP